MKNAIKTIAPIVLALIGTTLAGAAAHAAYPERPIKLIVPFPAGGTTDTVARFIAQGMGEKLGQSVIVDYKAGAATIIGADTVAQSAPDGYTLLLGTATTFTINPILYPKLSYDPLKSFTPIGVIGTTPLAIMATQNEPAKDLKGLIDNLRKDPGKYSYGSHGNGTPVHFAAEMLWSAAKVKVTHVPYKGSAPALNDLMGGQIPISVEALPAAVAAAKGGRVKVLAVTSDKRSPLMPEAPTVAESGYPGFSMQTWFALVAPNGLGKAEQDKLSQALSATLADPALKERLAGVGIEPGFEPAAGYVSRVQGDIAKLGPIARDNNIERN
ncbi:Bug family tripartite tricarboxylate transporter substrate binding protein [Pseudomonadota bacterium AL_CKDN230030165-1A_HGKHYDSX7]